MLSTQMMKLYAKMTKLSHTLEGFWVEVGQHYQKQECLFSAYLKTLQKRGAEKGPLGQYRDYDHQFTTLEKFPVKDDHR
jgi:hypothetical protein